MEKRTFLNGAERTNEISNKAFNVFKENREVFNKYGVTSQWRINPQTESWMKVAFKELESFTLGDLEWTIIEIDSLELGEGIRSHNECMYQPKI